VCQLESLSSASAAPRSLLAPGYCWPPSVSPSTAFTNSASDLVQQRVRRPSNSSTTAAQKQISGAVRPCPSLYALRTQRSLLVHSYSTKISGSSCAGAWTTTTSHCPGVRARGTVAAARSVVPAHTLLGPDGLTRCPSPPPAATLTKIVKDHLPAEMRCASDAMDMLMECCTGVWGDLAGWALL
jgi:hypothetical protein